MTNEACCLAWQRMRRLRHCPNLQLLRRGGPLIERHLKTCSYCRNALEHAEESAQLGQLLLEVPVTQPAESPMRAGDIRALLPPIPPEERVDEEGIFYNPPRVLLLEKPDRDGFVQVSQLFRMPDLEADGDIDLGNGFHAEAWNTYALPARHLEKRCFFRVSQELVQKVLDRARRPFPPLSEKSPLFHFRSDECMTGSFFSLSLNEVLLRELDFASMPVATARREEGSRTPLPDKGLLQRMLGCLLDLVPPPAAPDLSGALGVAGLGAVAGIGLFSAAKSLAALFGRKKDGEEAPDIFVMVGREDREPDTCRGELVVHTLPGGRSQCDITCHIADPLPDVTAAARYQEAVMPEEVHVSWQTEDTLHISAVFPVSELNREKLRVAIVLTGDKKTQ